VAPRLTKQKGGSMKIFRQVGYWSALVLLVAGCGPKNAAVRTDGAPRLIEHTVGVGETLDLIADNYYGDPARAGAVAEANGLSGTGEVVPGSVLHLKFNASEWETARRRAAALKPYNRGVDMLANGRLAAAEKQFRLALDTAPGMVSARYNLALVYLKRGRTDRALVLLAELTQARPANADFAFARGNALFQATRFEDAAVQFRSALKLRPDFRRAAFGLARSQQEAGHRRRAIAAWQAYLALDSTSSWAATARRNLRDLQEETKP